MSSEGNKKKIKAENNEEEIKVENSQENHDEHKSNESEEDIANAFGGANDDDKDADDKIIISYLKKKLIPPNLLSKPLPVETQKLLNDEERRLYNIQKTKFDGAQKKIKKMPIHPEERRYDIEEARLMLGGTFHDVEDGEEY